MAERVRITDVSPRDGLQNERGVVSTGDKVRLVGALLRAGLDEVEVSSFVSPRWVPQLGDAAGVFESVAELLGDPPPAPSRKREGVADMSPSRLREGLGEGVFPKVRIPRERETVNRARRLRRDSTWPERTLWSVLRDKKVGGLRFRRQHPIGPYIVDFFCASHAIAIEVDGESHMRVERGEHDKRREQWLREQGVRVLRFSNDEALRDPVKIAEAVLTFVRRSNGDPPPAPSHKGEGGKIWSPSRVREGVGEGLRTPLLSALVPNEKGFDAACEVNAKAGRMLIGKVSVFTAASETFSRKNTNASIDETIERFAAFVPRAFGMGFGVRMYVSCVVACPFEGPIAPGAVRRVVDKLRAIVPEGHEGEIDLGDTIGVAHPADIAALLGEFDDRERGGLTLHLHDTFGRAGECVRAALEMGVRSFDGSVAGLGGCPYAGTPEKPAPGNISTETLVRAVRDAGFACAVDDDALRGAASIAREIVARAREGASA